MNFLLGAWYTPWTWGDDFINNVLSLINWIFIMIDSMVYSFVSYVYQIFLALAQGVSLFDNTFVEELVGRIYIILGVVMLFLIAYSLLKVMINPDELTKGKNSPVNIIKDVLISIGLIALLPTIFDFAFDFQNSLLANNTIGKIIVGNKGSLSGDGTEDSAAIIRKGGYVMASGVWQAFMHANEGYCSTKSEEGGSCEVVHVDEEKTKTFGDLWDEAEKATTFWKFTQAIPAIVEGKVTYYFIVSTVAGVYILYVLFSYCIDMALRLVKLAVFEVIAPIPILARIIPNEQAKKVFSNWLKATISTFVEVFIRIALLFFAVLLISTVIASVDNFFGTLFSGSARVDILFFAQALIILGVIMFVKEAPTIIKDITGLDGGKFGKSFMRGIGMMTASIGGGTTAVVRSFVNDKEKPMSQRVRRAVGAGVGANVKGLWHGSKVQKFGDIPKQAGTTASRTLAHRAEIDAAGGRKEYYKHVVVDKAKDVKAWASGSFEVQQEQLNTINAFLEDANSVKKSSEGLVREKKFLFKYGNDKTFTHNGRSVTVDSDTTLSAMQAMIESLKSSGNVDDANLADQLNNDMEKRIKEIGKAIVTTSVEPSVLSRATFDATYMSGTNKLEEKAATTIAETKNAYELVQKRYVENGTLDAVNEFKKPATPGGPANTLRTDNVSDLADQLKIQSSNIQNNIKLEQERRKAKEKK